MSESSPDAATVPAGSLPLPSVGTPPSTNAPKVLPTVPNVAIPAGVPVNAAGVPTGEACPPPLVWQEVLQAYHADSQPWELDRGSRRLTGRTWGSGPPLYLLNGFAGTAEMYALLAYLLRDSFRCVVFDTQMKPESRRTRLTINDYAGDLLAVADHHGDASICVFAPSFGAAVALQAALDRPERIAGLVLQHGFASRHLSWTERLLARCCQGSQRPLQSLPWRRRVQELNHRRWFPPFDGTRFEFLVESTGKIPLMDLSRKALAMDAVNLQDQLPRVACPVLLIRTEGQGQLESTGHDLLAKSLPKSHSEWLHSTGLHPYLTHPHRLAKLLKPFFLGEKNTGAGHGD